MRIGWLALLVATRALAQASFSDGFNGGTSSPWSLTQNPRGVPFAVGVVDAGKVGSGFRIVDNDTATGSSVTMCFIEGVSGAGNQFSRVWFRNQPASTVGSAHPIMIHQSFGSQTAAEIIWDQSTQEFDLQCFDHNRNYAGRLGVEDGGWHLLELGVIGEGTTDAGCVAAIDGVVGRSFSSLDLDGGQFTQLLVGEPWGNLDFLGTLDFDEYRADPLPLPSRLVVTAALPIAPSTCWPIQVSIQGTFGGAVAPTLVDTPVMLNMPFGATYISPACTITGKLALIVAGTTTTNFWIRATTTYDVWATSADLVSVHLTGVTGFVDGGTADAGEVDAGATDGGTGADAGLGADAGFGSDAGPGADGGSTLDGGVADAGRVDADAGAADAGVVDGGLADAGPDDLSQDSLGVGCGCGASPDVALSLGLLGFLRYTRRRCRKSSARQNSSSSGSH